MKSDVKVSIRLRRQWAVKPMLPVAQMIGWFSPGKAAAFIWWWSELVMVAEMRMESGRWRRISW